MDSNEGPPPLKNYEQPPAGLPAQVVYPQHVQGDYVPSEDDKTMGMLIHLLSLLSGFVGPLILWLVKKDTSPFVDHHGKESINFMLTGLIISIVLIIAGIATWGVGFLLFFPYFILVYVFEIMACVNAYKGQWYQIPMTIRFIK